MNIYVGNLPYRFNEEMLREKFSSFGEVSSVSIITDKMTGRSKGFGFVEMPSDDAARSAIKSLENWQAEGRSIKVNEAKPRERQNGGRRFDRARA
jgi:RNA recognition motif-containing protein